MNRIYFADNLTVLQEMADASVDLIYIDPPFNTGRVQRRTRIKTIRSESGDRVGFQGNRYTTVEIGTRAFADMFDDYLAFLEPRLRQAYRVLAPHGSLYFHVDYREVHYCKVLLDTIFGRERFLNEIIWVYDYGGRPRRKWPPKHDNILLYVKDLEHYVFNEAESERIPYMAPGLGPEKAARSKLPTDTWRSHLNRVDRLRPPAVPICLVVRRHLRNPNCPRDPGGRSGMIPIVDPEVERLAYIATAIRKDYLQEDAAWISSPFAWIRTRPSRQVGKIGEQLIAGWCPAEGLNVVKMPLRTTPGRRERRLSARLLQRRNVVQEL